MPPSVWPRVTRCSSHVTRLVGRDLRVGAREPRRLTHRHLDAPSVRFGGVTLRMYCGFSVSTSSSVAPAAFARTSKLVASGTSTSSNSAADSGSMSPNPYGTDCARSSRPRAASARSCGSPSAARGRPTRSQKSSEPVRADPAAAPGPRRRCRRPRPGTTSRTVVQVAKVRDRRIGRGHGVAALVQPVVDVEAVRARRSPR